jgi:hypothetical protein
LRRVPGETFLPMTIACKEFLVALCCRPSLKPLHNRGFVKMDENPFPELFNRRQPVGITGNRRATNGQVNILDLAIRACRSGLEAREAIKAGDLP